MDAAQLFYSYAAGMAAIFAIAVFGLLMGVKIDERLQTVAERSKRWGFSSKDEVLVGRDLRPQDKFLS